MITAKAIRDIATAAATNPLQDDVSKAWDDVLTRLVMNVWDPSADPLSDEQVIEEFAYALREFLST